MSKRLYEMLFIWDFEYLELLSALGAIGWGITFFVTPDLFQISGAYSAMSTLIASEMIWGIISLIVGAVQLFFVYINKYRNFMKRRIVTLAAGGFWLFVSAMFYMSRSAVTTAVAIYFTLALASCWAYVRLSLRHRRFNE